MTIFPDGAQIAVMITRDKTVTDETVWTEHSRHDRMCEARYWVRRLLEGGTPNTKLVFVSGIKKKR